MALKGTVKTTATVLYKGTTYNLGEFKTFSGGRAGAGDGKSRNGAGQTQKARGGQQTVENVTVGREDDGSVDLKFLAGIRGKARMSVTRTPADDDGNSRANDAFTYNGVLIGVVIGDGDVESESDIDDFTLEMSCDSEIA
jgi:hypothetical protein